MRVLSLAATFGLALSLIPLRLPAEPLPRGPKQSLRLAQKSLERFDAQLRRNKGQTVYAEVRELVDELRASGVESHLVEGLRVLALAEAGSGREAEAVWHWQVAQNLQPGLALDDPAAYGEAGALLARHTLRRRDAAPAGMEAVAAADLGAGATPPRKIAGAKPEIHSFLASPGASRWARLQVAVDPQGRVVEPVVLAGHSKAFRWAVLEAVRTWRFEPARREGQPVAVLLDIDIPPRTETPLAEMLPFAGKAGRVHDLLLKHDWRGARSGAATLVQSVAEEGEADPRQSAAALALLALADAGSEGGSRSTCYWHAAQSLYGDLYHASLAAYGTAGALLEASNPWMQDEEIPHLGSSPGGKTVMRPEKIGGPQPQYTTRARLAGVRGVIITEGVIDENGRITQLRLIKGLSPGLDLNTLITLCGWRFKPATVDGKPVKVYYSVTTSFEVFSSSRPAL